MRKPKLIKCLVTSPLYIHGADRSKPELRIPAIKAAMRYWWRALHPDYESGKELYKAESKIFGGTSGEEGGNRAVFSLRLKKSTLDIEQRETLPHKSGFKSDVYADNSEFTLSLLCPPEHERSIAALLELAGLIGGIGQRSRRGFGNFLVYEEYGDFLTVTTNYLETLIRRVRPKGIHFHRTSSELKLTYQYGTKLKFPYLTKIRFGEWAKDLDELIRATGQTTHDELRKNRNRYTSTIAGATGEDRFGSTVWISIGPEGEEGKDSVQVLAAYVHPVPPSGTSTPGYQDAFVNAIKPKL